MEHVPKNNWLYNDNHEKQNNQPARRTHSTLRDALIASILDRGCDKTTVQDVRDRVDVGRSTFYTDFTSKEKLLISGFDTLCQIVRAQENTSENCRSHAFQFVHGLIDHGHDDQRLSRTVIEKSSGLVVRALRYFLLIVPFITVISNPSSRVKKPTTEVTSLGDEFRVFISLAAGTSSMALF